MVQSAVSIEDCQLQFMFSMQQSLKSFNVATKLLSVNHLLSTQTELLLPVSTSRTCIYTIIAFSKVFRRRPVNSFKNAM